MNLTGGDSFERVPYWLNGLVPLAFLLQEQNLMNQMNTYLDYILAHQNSNGWYTLISILSLPCLLIPSYLLLFSLISPFSSYFSYRIGPTCCDPWPRFPLLLALMQYAEAKPGDTRIVPAMWKFFNKYGEKRKAKRSHERGSRRGNELNCIRKC